MRSGPSTAHRNTSGAAPTVLRTILARVFQGSVVTINSGPAGLMPREK